MMNTNTGSKNVKSPQTPQQDERVNTLLSAISDMDSMTQAGFSRVRAIATLVALSFETVEGNFTHHQETVVAAVNAIKQIAFECADYVSDRADEFNAAHVDKNLISRLESQNAAKEELRISAGQGSKGAR